MNSEHTKLLSAVVAVSWPCSRLSISSILVVYMELRLHLRLHEVENLGEKE